MVVGIIVALIVLLVALIIVVDHENDTASAFTEAEKEVPTQPLKYTTNVVPGSEKKRPPLKSLDAVYAEKNGLWVCNYCETLNQNGSLQCAACGENR